MAIPAVSSWLINFNPEINAPLILNHQVNIAQAPSTSTNPEQIKTLVLSSFTSSSSRRRGLYRDSENNGHYIHTNHTPIFEPGKLRGSSWAAFPSPCGHRFYV